VDVQVLGHGQFLVEVYGLGHHPDPAFGGRFPEGIMAVDQGLAGAGSGQAGQQPDGRGLARAVGPQVGEDFSGGYGKADPAQGEAAPVVLAELVGGDA